MISQSLQKTSDIYIQLFLAICEDLPYPGYDFTNRLFE